ncbi:uncharacterized protein LOC134447039 [Engraulis encrasicolus]|uniref:uncharacterized protein LOC134447039 n=1 Tax=Engraulis encrasicolus TaxID=184585 RepID=UPI002FD1DE3F
MARLSACIFEWDAEDLALLRRAKREQLTKEGLPTASLTDVIVDNCITKAELALHCRRRTRGTDNTIRLLGKLIEELSGPKGRDAMGVGLFEPVRIQHLWNIQKRHVGCIQDLPDVPLYTQTGTLNKGGVALKTYRCARGSTSLESFHCHLARFIPGNSANSLNFQIYLLEGLFRWNKDRAAAALAVGDDSRLRTYSGELVYAVNTNYTALFGVPLIPGFSPPAAYTGELIGVQYLLRQSRQPLEDMTPGSPRTSELLEDISVEQEVEEDEGFIDTLGEEAIVDVLVAPDAELPVIHRPTPQDPRAQLPTVQLPTPPQLPAVQVPPQLPTVQVPPQLPTVQLPPQLPTVQLPPQLPTPPQLSTVQVPPQLPAVQPSTTQGPSLLPTTTQGPFLLPAAPTPPAPPVRASGHGIPGLARADELAEYLVELRSQTSLVLSPQQEDTIVGLWQNLDPYDKEKLVYAARHQDRLLTGKFRSPKKRADFTPGVDSTKRCVLGSTGSPAQWPDCCRLIELIFIRLCNIYRTPKKQGTASLSRWDCILRDYRKIRQLILMNSANHGKMRQTTLQLVVVNQTTLISWHNDRLKKQEVSVLLQGLDLPVARPVSSDPLPPAQLQPASPPRHSHPLHTYNMPPNTAGQVKTKLRKILPSASASSAAVPPAPASISHSAPRHILPKPSADSQFITPRPVSCPVSPACTFSTGRKAEDAPCT